MICSTALMFTASSTWFRAHFFSQGWKHTRPVMAGKRLDAAVAPGRFAKVPLLDQVMVAANVDPGGASRHARGKGLLRGFEPENIQWACLGAGSAAGTGRRIDACGSYELLLRI